MGQTFTCNLCLVLPDKELLNVFLCQTEQKYHLSESEQLGSDAISNEMQDPKNKVYKSMHRTFHFQ